MLPKMTTPFWKRLRSAPCGVPPIPWPPVLRTTTRRAKSPQLPRRSSLKRPTRRMISGTPSKAGIGNRPAKVATVPIVEREALSLAVTSLTDRRPAEIAAAGVVRLAMTPLARLPRPPLTVLLPKTGHPEIAPAATRPPLLMVGVLARKPRPLRRPLEIERIVHGGVMILAVAGSGVIAPPETPVRPATNAHPAMLALRGPAARPNLRLQPKRIRFLTGTKAVSPMICSIGWEPRSQSANLRLVMTLHATSKRAVTVSCP